MRLKSFFTSFEIEKGDAIAYRIDNPEIGDAKEYNLYNVFRFSDNFKISLGHRYSELKNKVTGEEFYAGEINRFEIDYQIDGALSTRTIIEKNDFSDDYFLEALIQWKPNPYTIFYAGGTQFYKELLIELSATCIKNSIGIGFPLNQSFQKIVITEIIFFDYGSCR